MTRQQHNNNQQRRNTAQRQARADLWDMVNAFVTTPDLQTLQFENSAGAIVMTKAESDEQRKRIGFETTYAVSNSEINAPDDYDEDDDSDDGYNDFVNTFVRWFD